ncbi:hypothetical protein COOONC_17716 [Cooperia oncophora]
MPDNGVVCNRLTCCTGKSELRDMGRVNVMAYVLEISHHTVVQWEQTLCSVEINVTVVTKCEHQWALEEWLFGRVVGGCERASLRLVRDRGATVLLRLITKYLLYGATPLTAGPNFRAFPCIEECLSTTISISQEQSSKVEQTHRRSGRSAIKLASGTLRRKQLKL